ncbi:endosome/lysosome-associated apoptosis and autophagy regulator family member 2 [Hydra vulgaris]|uniref:endosome/lysosome-associated apoptosis and autophagy regulator family member 2 n=1 Tax=Hydra vulgaris TaxID=6087 RepID=UPI000640CB1C|nr:endosome/lysosome-associated apoptosis and autophagy regulator family member 2 [Hydra vulgaris]
MAILAYCCIILLFICFILFTNEASPSSLKPCTFSNFERIILPCNITEKKRKAVYYMNEECDLKHSDSITPPKPINDLLCNCDAGYGQTSNAVVNITCVKCKPGQFNHGGEILSDFTNWSDSSGKLGLTYRAYSYCSDFLSKKQCESWGAGGNGEYLVSGDIKNTTDIRCFEQSYLVLNRQFSGLPGNNKISFLYRVDGRECDIDHVNYCTNGLFFYVNGIQKMHSDYQFQWKEFTTEVDPGPVQFKFLYQRSCSKAAISDVAFIKHLSMVGSFSTESKCSECPAGSYSSLDGATECLKCNQNYYQDKIGQSQCIPCPKGEFSGIGAISCFKLPDCTQKDFYLLPDSVAKCKKNSSGSWLRNQSIYVPKWPNVSDTLCNVLTNASDQYKRPDNPQIMCYCQPGYFLDVSGPIPKCTICKLGLYSDGIQTECMPCKSGYAALRGLYMDHFPEGPLPNVFKQSCSGEFCKDEELIWEPRGNYIATRRLPGSFETILEVIGVEIDYFNPVLTFSCSVDCRLNSNDSKLAKLSHCYLKYYVLKDGQPYFDGDCVDKYSSHLRNGTIFTHQHNLTFPGNYSFRFFFHHEDEGKFSLISFEARIYYVDLLGVKYGSAKQCTECPAGTVVSMDQSTCEKCPNGTFSRKGSTKCTPCPLGTFASEVGSESCIMCGNGTTSNARRDDCEFNGCIFSPEKDLNFDLSPLISDGGPMYEVKTYRTNSYLTQLFYINICSKKHDNTSCAVNSVETDPITNTNFPTQKLLKTMACKRYYFDKMNSYSIGEVLSFEALEGEKKRSGLKITLTGGQSCWNKWRRYISPQTTILMICDLEAGENRPEPLNNFTAIDDRNCIYEFMWKTLYACPLCTQDDYSEVFSECKNGYQYKTKTKKNKCRTAVGEKEYSLERFPCNLIATSISSKSPKFTTLVITILIAITLIIALLIILIYLIRRNRHLRSNLFAPGQSFSKVQHEDEDELVDNMQT